jgi:hypothetical protein
MRAEKNGIELWRIEFLHRQGLDVFSGNFNLEAVPINAPRKRIQRVRKLD